MERTLGEIIAADRYDLKVKVLGFDDGERVAKKVLLLDPTQERLTFGRKFDDIER